MKTEPILAWHFVGDTLRDGGPIPKDGVWLKVPAPIVICERGLHASRNPFDALKYAPGTTLCRVAVRGHVIEQEDKLAGSERKIIARMDAAELLRYFARMQAVSALENWQGEPDQVILDWLMTGDAAAYAAYAAYAARSAAYAARSAAESAAWSAAWSAAESAAYAAQSAAQSAAYAAQSAAESAAQSAAQSAARSAAQSAAREEFTALVHECFGVSE